MADVINLPPNPGSGSQQAIKDFAAALKNAGERGELPRGKPQQPVFAPSMPMPGVVPEGARTMAMDSAVGNSTNWAADQLLAAYYSDGMSFLGYPLLAELAQRGEYRRLSEVIATEMTREWIILKSSSDEDKSLEINALNDEIKRLGVQDAFRKLAEQDGFFGRAHLYIDLGTTDNPDELKTPIGHGRDVISPAKIRKDGLKALRTVEAVWCYPVDYNASDPLSDRWYKPQSWFVMGKQIHATRLLTLVGREVPDLLKPAYMFGGLPLSQMAKTYIDKWTQTRDSVADLIRSFSTAVMLTDLTAMLNNGGQQIVQNRADLYNFFRDNRALLILNKETEEFQNISTPLAGLDALQAQSQEHICSISGLPLIKYTGLTPSGLNASSEGEIRSFYDWIAAYQELLFREPLTRVIDFIQLSRLGKVDPDITFDFKSLWQLDEAGKASVQATKADIHSKYEEMGAVSNEEVRRILATDPESPYVALEMDPEDLPAEPPAPPIPGAGQPGLGGPPRPPGGGPHPGGAVTSVTSPFGATRDPASGRQSLAARRAGDMALDDAPVPLDPDLLEIARGAPSNIIQYIYGLQAERDRLRSPFDQAEWEEAKHRREAHGRFTSGGGGGGIHQHIPSATPGVGARTAAAVGHHIGEVGRPEAQAIHEALKPGGEARKSWASKVVSMAKALPQHIWHEEKTHAIHAAGGLKAMATGSRPTPEQMKGLRSFGLRVAMSGGSMLLTGDPTGTVAHAAVMLAQEIVQHVIIEHGAKLGIGMARAAVGGGDAAPDDDLTPDDIARLQAFLDDLAEAIANYDPEAEAKKKAPLTGDAKWLADWFAEDAEFEESKVTRKHGQFAKKGEGAPGAKKEEGEEKPEEEPEPEEVEKKEPEPEAKKEPEPAAAEPVKRAAPQRGRPTETFISPNVRDLTFPQAQAELGGVRQKALGEISKTIDQRLGLRETQSAAVIGAWSDGAENSLMVAMRGDPAMVRAAAAMKGAVSNQKAVLVFQPDPEGREHMANFEMPGDLSQIHDQLLQGGLAFHTLEPTPGGAKVHIYATDQDTADAIMRVAAGRRINMVSGTGEFIGTKLDTGTDEEQRADAQRAYATVIAQTEDQMGSERGGPDIGAVWRDADDHWREATWTQTGVEPPIGADPRERALSDRDILYGDTPAIKARSRTVSDIAGELMARGSAALRNLGVPGGRIQGPSPRTDHLLSRVIASEIKDAAARAGHAGNWYTSKVKQAMDVAATMHPELATDPHARTAYTAALAITSQGEKVPSNVRLADQAYRSFKQTGRFPTNIEAQEQIAMNSNFQKYNDLLDTLGPEGTRQFLNTERTAGELTADGYPIQGENIDTPVYGSAIFGPKIGQGFFQNLNGNYNPVTMDLWFMRAWGRLAGTLKGQLDPASFAKTQGRFERAIAAGGGSVPPTPAELKSQADAIVALHERDYAAHAAEYRAKTRLKSELTLSAERMVHAMDGINEQPSSGGQRIWMRDVVNHARQMLASEGQHLTNADLQAIWWYPEKELYAKLGGRDTEGTNVDYSTAMQAEARKNGIPGEAIAKAVGPMDR